MDKSLNVQRIRIFWKVRKSYPKQVEIRLDIIRTRVRNPPPPLLFPCLEKQGGGSKITSYRPQTNPHRNVGVFLLYPYIYNKTHKEMKKIIKLTEKDLQRIIKKVLNESKYSVLDPGQSEYYDEMEKNSPDDEDWKVRQKRREDEYYKWERFKFIIKHIKK